MILRALTAAEPIRFIHGIRARTLSILLGLASAMLLLIAAVTIKSLAEQVDCGSVIRLAYLIPIMLFVSVAGLTAEGYSRRPFSLPRFYLGCWHALWAFVCACIIVFQLASPVRDAALTLAKSHLP